MITVKDLCVFLLLLLASIMAALLLLGFDAISNSPYLFLLPEMVIFGGTALSWAYYKRKRNIAPFLEREFRALGYKILMERPFSFRELFLAMEIRVGVWIPSRLSIARIQYKSKYARVFTVADANQRRFTLFTCITFNWTGESDVDVRKKQIDPD